MAHQPCQLPQSNRGDRYSAGSMGAADSRGSLFGQFFRFAGEPHQHMGIEQDHFFVISHSTGMGDSISPTILTFPVRPPKMLFFSGSAGTTLTTGAPRLVMMTGSPVGLHLFHDRQAASGYKGHFSGLASNRHPQSKAYVEAIQKFELYSQGRCPGSSPPCCRFYKAAAAGTCVLCAATCSPSAAKLLRPRWPKRSSTPTGRWIPRSACNFSKCWVASFHRTRLQFIVPPPNTSASPTRAPSRCFPRWSSPRARN